MAKRFYTDDPKKPSTLVNVWRRYISKEIYAKLSVTDKNLLTVGCVGYILRVHNFVKLAQLLKPTCLDRLILRKLRAGLIADYNVCVSLKLWLLRNVALRARNKPLQLNMTNYGLYDNDIAIFTNLEAMGLLQPLQYRLQHLPNDRLPSAKRIQTECQELLAEIKPFIEKYVYRKMSFIISSQKIPMRDLAADLNLKAIEVFYFLTPFVSFEHRKNIVKRSVHNHGINIIKMYGGQGDNSRLRYTNGGWYNIVRTSDVPAAINNHYDDNTSLAQDNNPSLMMGSPAYNKIENQIALRQFLSENKELHSKIILLLSMKDDYDFIQFVNSRGHNFADNENVFDTLGRAKYLKLIAKYLQVPKQDIKNAVDKLQQSLQRV